MKKQLTTLFFVCAFFCPLFINAQAHLGSSQAEILDLHPNKTFKSGTTNGGERYIYSDMTLGTFYYYFSNSTNKTYACRQYPYNLEDLNTQVQLYNKKYVVTSNTSWTAYLDGGGIMYIKLVYSEDYKVYHFSYADEQANLD